MDDDSFTALGPATTGFLTNFNPDAAPLFLTGVAGRGNGSGVFGRAGQAEGPRVNNVYSQHAGVVGDSRDFPGAAGASVNNIGVYGQTGEQGAVANLVAGVYGTGNLRPGVIGSSSQGFGVQGASFLGIGVSGGSFRSPGVQGQSFAASGVSGVSGTFGPTIPSFTNVAGVLGTSDALNGVIGTSNKGVGVFGFSNNFGVVGQTTNPASFAGFFNGNVLVFNGSLTASVKNAMVAFPDGTQRLLHCMESPEHWFEDFGAAKLRNGRAVVKLDANFAKVIKRDGYRVFVTPEGDCRGLYVRSKSAARFEVRELAGGKSSVTFSYRVVGRRNDIKAHKRFAKIDTPLPAAPTRAQRKGAPTPAELRAFVADLEKEAGVRIPKGARKARIKRGRHADLAQRQLAGPA